MARIYDNIEIRFLEGLQGIISNVGVKNVDFCVGYFNLRGWNAIVNEIDNLPGDYIYEKDERIFRTCRLLIGMHRPPEDLVRNLYSSFDAPMMDQASVQRIKRQIAGEKIGRSHV